MPQDYIDTYVPEGYTFVQFCPCGHTYNVRTETLKNPIDPNKLDAPILSSRDCEVCKEDRADQDRLTAFMCEPWDFEDDFSFSSSSGVSGVGLSISEDTANGITTK